MRAPCCEKMGLKKGPWTPEEDQILVSYIQRHGHDNWRALPKQAGLHRCGKSCRLRWTNYLRPDIKRGNFSREEEETIIKLHQALGNRWSAIATRLPGRTDNEIKNFWHTHLKKRLQQNLACTDTIGHYTGSPMYNINMRNSGPVNFSNHLIFQSLVYAPSSTQNHSEKISSSDSTVVKTVRPPIEEDRNASPKVPEMKSSMASKFLQVSDPRLQFLCSTDSTITPRDGSNSNINDDMDFWYNLFIKAGDQLQNYQEK